MQLWRGSVSFQFICIFLGFHMLHLLYSLSFSLFRIISTSGYLLGFAPDSQIATGNTNFCGFSRSDYFYTSWIQGLATYCLRAKSTILVYLPSRFWWPEGYELFLYILMLKKDTWDYFRTHKNEVKMSVSVTIILLELSHTCFFKSYLRLISCYISRNE